MKYIDENNNEVIATSYEEAACKLYGDDIPLFVIVCVGHAKVAIYEEGKSVLDLEIIHIIRKWDT